MRLGICGPVATMDLAPHLDACADLPPGLGGSPVVALARAALARGWRVVVFSLDPSVTEEYVVDGPTGLRLCLGPYRERHRARDCFRQERNALSQMIRRERPDVVHAHWTYEFALGALDSQAPTLVTAHDRPLHVLRWNPSPYRLVRTWMARMVSKRAPRITAVSHAVADHYRQWMGCRLRPVVIPNSVDPEWFAPRETNTGAGVTFAAVLTGWGEMKNGRTLLEAFAKVRRNLRDARLLLFGHGHGPAEAAENWAGAAGLSAGVSFVGQVPPHVLRQALERADVLVHPSREESFSMAIAEAMANSVPVIAARQSAVIANESNAALVDGNSAEAMAGEMLRLAADPCRRRVLAACGSRFARERFWPDTVLDQYAAVYRSL